MKTKQQAYTHVVTGADQGIFDWGGGGVRTLVQRGLFDSLRQLPSLPYPLHPLPAVAVARYNSWSLVKDAPLEHPPVVFVTKITDFVNIIVKVVIQCMSASPDNRSSDILFLRYDLIHR